MSGGQSAAAQGIVNLPELEAAKILPAIVMKRLVAYLILALWVAPCALAQNASLTVATTTSVEDSGLFAFLLPKFESRTGMKVRVLSRGSSAVLTAGERGEADVVIVNDSEVLDRFVRSGNGVRRHALMYNDFVIAGPPSDPAGVAGSKDAPAALRTIARLRAAFISRGDGSGTHAAERRLWLAAGVDPKARSGDWYREAGMGMGATVEMAGRLGAYVLTDRATWHAHRAGDQRVLVEGDARLFDQYEVAMANPARHAAMDAAAAAVFIDWLVSDEGQGSIAAFRIDGHQAFAPNGKPLN
jgi:tungstate transport system substrate-binding protein